MIFWKNIFLGKNFFYAMTAVVVCFCFSFFYPTLFEIAQLALFSVAMLFIIDLILLYSSKSGIRGSRITNDKLSNFELNLIKIKLQNHYFYPIRFEIYDELPPQFQIFDFKLSGQLSAKKEVELNYELQPKERGEYKFGKTNVFARTPMGILQRKIILNTQKEIKVYPAFLKLNQYTLQNFKAHVHELGQKKVRRIGHSMEFEQIKNYVPGDDIRTINWKATAKSQKLMVNQYIDEKSQQIYCAIDKGRVMKMPFNGLSLLDYAINSSLILSNIVLENQDRAGVFTFSKQLENLVKAERRSNQLQKISESLYSIKSDFMESDYGKLYNTIKHKITQRSLIVLFSNFESLDSLHRQLPYLLGINKNHLLVIVFFRNTELEDFVQLPAQEVDPYQKTMAEKFIYEKQQIVLELNKYGIQTVLSHPEDLTIHTINKYLEIKAKAMI